MGQLGGRGYLSPRVYALAVQRAGGLALILPPDEAVAEMPDRASTSLMRS